MRRRIVAGNWKMNTNLEDAKALVISILNDEMLNQNTCQVIIAPPFTHLYPISQLIGGSKIEMASQNCASEKSGGFTGEVSIEMLQSVGTKYVIIGHSERRQYFGEESAILLKKLQLTLEAGLTPIFCIGEQLAERENGTYNATVEKQLTETVFKLSVKDFKNIILAYEPVWAIGTGKVATPEQAQDMHKNIRTLIRSQFEEEMATETQILYGGSCKPDNATELFGQSDVDGGLIGGASLKASDFLAIINA